MNDEIKEILSNDNIHIIECDKNWCNAYGYEKSQLKEDLLNYITNLQEENEDLKDRLKVMEHFKNSLLEENERLKFWLDGCDISFVAEAPEDITLKQLLKQCDRIEPHWCACGINTKDVDVVRTEIFIDYNDIRKADDNVSCNIL